jgi:hypothetical protein
VTDLLASFAAAGGAPPASQVLVRVFRDGRVRALAGTAWPGLGPVDEAGAYAFELDARALAELERLAQAAAGEELDGPREPGSGRFALDVGDAARLRWDPFTTPSEPVAALADRLRALLAEARAHPLAAVRLEVEAAGGDPLRLTYRFTALGSEPLSLTVASLRARVVEVPSEPSEPPPLAWVREATPVETSGGGRTSLAPGETLTLEGATSAPPGRVRADGFARVALGDVEATLGAGPASPAPEGAGDGQASSGTS